VADEGTSVGPARTACAFARAPASELGRSPVHSGAAFVVLAVMLAARTPLPDILVAADGRTFAVRSANGKLAFHRTGSDTFATREWLASDADGRDVNDKGLGDGIACDPLGCVGKLADGRAVSYAFAPDAFEEDCRRAAIIVATRDAPPDCDATVIGRKQWREQGALALYRSRSGFTIEPARPLNYDRPWAPRIVRAAANVSSQETPGSATAPPAHPRHRATPRLPPRSCRRMINCHSGTRCSRGPGIHSHDLCRRCSAPSPD
jgi:competence protein ComEC